jgi:hypothetical protein
MKFEAASLDKRKGQVVQFEGRRDLESSIRHSKLRLLPEFSIGPSMPPQGQRF